MAMTNNRPYIARALYNWIADNDCTPYILVDSHWPNINLPPQFSDEEKIVLNISSLATRELEITSNEMTFLTRFDGETFTIKIPINAVLALYAQENGQGMVFDPEPYPDTEETETPEGNSAHQEASPLISISNPDAPQTQDAPSVSKGRPSLKIVK